MHDREVSNVHTYLTYFLPHGKSVFSFAWKNVKKIFLDQILDQNTYVDRLNC